MTDAVSGLQYILQKIIEAHNAPANMSAVSAALPTGESADPIASGQSSLNSGNSRSDTIAVLPPAADCFSKHSDSSPGYIPQVFQLQQQPTLFAATSPQEWSPAQLVRLQPQNQTVGGFPASQTAVPSSSQSASGNILTSGNFSTPPPSSGVIPQLQHCPLAQTVPSQPQMHTAGGFAAFSSHSAPLSNLGLTGPLCLGQGSFNSARIHAGAVIFDPTLFNFSRPPPVHGDLPQPPQFLPQYQRPQTASASLQPQTESVNSFPSYASYPAAAALDPPKSSNLQKQQCKETGRKRSQSHFSSTSAGFGAKRPNRSTSMLLVRRDGDQARNHALQSDTQPATNPRLTSDTRSRIQNVSVQPHSSAVAQGAAQKGKLTNSAWDEIDRKVWLKFQTRECVHTLSDRLLKAIAAEITLKKDDNQRKGLGNLLTAKGEDPFWLHSQLKGVTRAARHGCMLCVRAIACETLIKSKKIDDSHRAAIRDEPHKLPSSKELGEVFQAVSTGLRPAGLTLEDEMGTPEEILRNNGVVNFRGLRYEGEIRLNTDRLLRDRAHQVRLLNEDRQRHGESSQSRKTSSVLKKADEQWVEQHACLRYLRFLLKQDPETLRSNSNDLVRTSGLPWRQLLYRALDAELYGSGREWAQFFIKEVLGLSVETFRREALLAATVEQPQKPAGGNW